MSTQDTNSPAWAAVVGKGAWQGFATRDEAVAYVESIVGTGPTTRAVQVCPIALVPDQPRLLLIRRARMNALEVAEKALKDIYVNTKDITPEQFRTRISEIHADMSDASGTGPCGCMACREVRGTN